MPIENLYDEKYLQKLYDSDDFNTQYVHSIFCEEYEKQMYEAIL
jgi:hypothetical protein